MFTVLNCIMYICLSLCWTLYWTFPSFAEFQKAISHPPQQEQPTKLPFFSGQELKSSQLLKKTAQKKRVKKSSQRRQTLRKIEVPMGADSCSLALPRSPKRKIRVASVA